MARSARIRWTGERSALKLTHSDPSQTPRIRELTSEHIGVAFQPISDAQSGKLFAYEALVRCRVEELKAPPKLLEAAVDQEACGYLGRVIRHVAFDAVPDVPLFVNLHPNEITSRWLVRPDDPLAFHSSTVYLEITETAALSHFEICRRVLGELCARTGSKLVVDDFGAGHSNLLRVLELNPDVVKLDMSLIRDIHERKKQQLIVSHMVQMCHALDACTVAEGIETVDELNCVRDLGVDWVQGYLLGKPAFPAEPPMDFGDIDEKLTIPTRG